MAEGLQKGDKIEYVPHRHYAFQKDASGDRPWKIGVKRNTGKLDPATGQAETVVTPLDGRAIDLHLDYVKRHPNPNEELKNVVLLEPAKTWPGIVIEVTEDGTYGVECASDVNTTLQLRGVAFDPEKKLPHSCHRSGHTQKIGG